MFQLCYTLHLATQRGLQFGDFPKHVRIFSCNLLYMQAHAFVVCMCCVGMYVHVLCGCVCACVVWVCMCMCCVGVYVHVLCGCMCCVDGVCMCCVDGVCMCCVDGVCMCCVGGVHGARQRSCSCSDLYHI